MEKNRDVYHLRDGYLSLIIVRSVEEKCDKYKDGLPVLKQQNRATLPASRGSLVQNSLLQGTDYFKVVLTSAGLVERYLPGQ